ncbi:cuticle protein 16.5-like [Anopheles bellator]|uniref:cuticle protein 16.5-like n=1 Tax=Anopheles bellator TaxID=139047 RepID=UPI0026497E6B|nr:cuticle protein 16.5-like [Anopheles bellator]
MKFLILLGLVAVVRGAPGFYGDGLSYAAYAAAPAPIVKYAAPAVSVVHAAPAPVLKYAVAPAPIVKAIAPAATSYATFHQVHAPVVAAAPVVKYAAPAPVVSYVHSAPVVAHSAPLIKYAPSYHGW